MKHNVQEVAQDFLSFDNCAILSFSLVEIRFCNILELKFFMVQLLYMLLSDLVKKFLEDWFVFIVESSMVYTDAALNTFCLVNYHPIPV